MSRDIRVMGRTKSISAQSAASHKAWETRKRTKKARSKAIVKKDKLLSDLRYIERSVTGLRHDLKVIYAGVESIRDFDAKRAFVQAINHIANHQELRAPLLLLVDAINRLSNDMNGRDVPKISDAINTLGGISNSLSSLTELMGKSSCGRQKKSRS